MNRVIKGICTFLPHLIIAMSLTLLTLSVTDHFNTAMAFINHPMTKRLIVIYCLIALANCLVLFVRGSDEGLRKTAVPLICAAVTAAMLTALLYDRLFPREILFAKDFGKTLIFVNTMVSLVCAAYSAELNRRIALKRYRKKHRRSGKE